ncbi:MAG: hypothetical protein ACXADA_08055 [Candidatus Hodarchaeales archaeon]
MKNQICGFHQLNTDIRLTILPTSPHDPDGKLSFYVLQLVTTLIASFVAIYW